MEIAREVLIELLELQKIDSRIDRMEQRRRNLPEQAALEELEDQRREAEKLVGEQEAVVEDVVRRHNKLDADVDLISQKIKAEEEKLYGGDVTSPRELQNLQAEIDSLKRRRTSMEDVELEVMEEREVAEAKLGELTDGFRSLSEQVDEAMGKRDVAAREIDEQLAQAREERSRWAPKFSGDVLSFYDELRESRKGVAIAAFTDGTCQGCHMKLPAQEAKRIMEADGVIYCDECRRVLVVV